MILYWCEFKGVRMRCVYGVYALVINWDLLFVANHVNGPFEYVDDMMIVFLKIK